MLNFQDAALAANAIDTNVASGLDGSTTFSAAVWADILTQDTNDRVIFNVQRVALAQLQFRFSNANPPNLEAAIGDGATVDIVASSSTVDAALHSHMFTYDGANVDFYTDGSADGTPAANNTLDVSTDPDIILGNVNGLNLGVRALLGHFMLWNDTLVAADATEYNNGVSVSNPADLVYWHRGVLNPGASEFPLAHTAATASGTVTLTAGTPDDYYFGDDGMMSVLGCWLPALISSGLFGAYLKFEPVEKILPAIMKVAGCHIEGWYQHELHGLFEMMQVRPRFCFQGFQDD